MGKSLFIAEKPSVAQEFAKALKINGRKSDGFIESDNAIVTWCVGHLQKGYEWVNHYLLISFLFRI